MALAVLLLLAGCSQSGQETTSDQASPCLTGRSTFTGKKDAFIPAAVTKPVTVTAKKGGPVGGKFELGEAPVTKVTTTTEGLPEEEIYQQFLDTYQDPDVGRPVDWGTKYELPAEARVTVGGPVSRSIQVMTVNQYTAAFTYTCGKTSYDGTVTGWAPGGAQTSVECDYAGHLNGTSEFFTKMNAMLASVSDRFC